MNWQQERKRKRKLEAEESKRLLSAVTASLAKRGKVFVKRGRFNGKGLEKTFVRLPTLRKWLANDSEQYDTESLLTRLAGLNQYRLDEAATTLQAAVRRFVARCNYLRTTAAAGEADASAGAAVPAAGGAASVDPGLRIGRKVLLWWHLTDNSLKPYKGFIDRVDIDKDQVTIKYPDEENDYFVSVDDALRGAQYYEDFKNGDKTPGVTNIPNHRKHTVREADFSDSDDDEEESQPIAGTRHSAGASRSSAGAHTSSSSATNRSSAPAAATRVIAATQTKELQLAPHIHYKKTELGLVVDRSFGKKSEAERNAEAVASAAEAVNSSSNHKQRPQGMTYDGGKLEKEGDVLFINGNTDISVTLSSGSKTTVKVRHIDTSTGMGSRFAIAARAIARKWSPEKSNCKRSSPGGGMIVIGAKRGAGNVEHFYDGPTKRDLDGRKGLYNGINTLHRDANVAAKEIAEEHFPDALASIAKAMGERGKVVPGFLGGADGLCDNLIQSKALENEYHVDLDMSKCLSIWTTEAGNGVKDPKGWYFVMPFLSCEVDGRTYKGVAVRLEHGVGIEWDGRELFHCSTAPKVGVNGTYFGVNRD